MSRSPFVVDVSSADFQAQVIERSRDVPVVVDFWAEWCGPCRMLGPVLEKLADEAGGAFVLAKLDTDANQELAARYRIQGIPAVKAFVGGEVVDEFVGVQSEAWLRPWLQGLAPSEADQHAAAGQLALDAGDLAAAGAAFGAALSADPRHLPALLGQGQVALGLGDLDAVEQVLAAVPEEAERAHAAALSRLRNGLAAGRAGDPAELEARLAAAPDDHDTRYALAMALHAAGRTEDALGHLLEIVRRDRKWRDDEGRKAMLRIFEEIGLRTPLSDRWRQKLAFELY